MAEANAARDETLDTADRGEARELALRALMTAHQFLTSAERELPRIVEALGRSEVEPISKELSQLLEGLGALTQLEAELRVLTDGGASEEAQIDPDELRGSLQALVESQQIGDWPQVGRVLGTRIAPLLSSMRSLFDRRAEQLQTR